MIRPVKRERRPKLGFEALSPHMRQILDLRCRDGLTVAETAGELGVAESTIKKTMKTIRIRIDADNIAHACWLYRAWKDQ